MHRDDLIAGGSADLVPMPEAIVALAALPDNEPVVMLNLLRFSPGGGARAYAKYATDFKKILDDLGGRILFAGRAEQLLVGEGRWHHVTLVRYPNRRTFIEMFEGDAYRKIHANRQAGLEKTLLYALRQVG